MVCEKGDDHLVDAEFNGTQGFSGFTSPTSHLAQDFKVRNGLRIKTKSRTG